MWTIILTWIWLDPYRSLAGAYSIQKSSPFVSVPSQVPKLSLGPPNCYCLFLHGSSRCATGSDSLSCPLRVPLKSLLLNDSVRISESVSQAQPSQFSFPDLPINPKLSGYFPQTLIWYCVGLERSYDASQTPIHKHLDLWCDSAVQSLTGI